jgi:hypothetical protein
VLLQAEAVQDMTRALAACDRWAKLDCASGGWRDGCPIFNGGLGTEAKDLTGLTLFECNNSSLLEQVVMGWNVIVTFWISLTPQPTLVVAGSTSIGTSPPLYFPFHSTLSDGTASLTKFLLTALKLFIPTFILKLPLRIGYMYSSSSCVKFWVIMTRLPLLRQESLTPTAMPPCNI